MIRMILRQIWNERRANALVFLELLVVSVCLFYTADYVRLGSISGMSITWSWVSCPREARISIRPLSIRVVRWRIS